MSLVPTARSLLTCHSQSDFSRYRIEGLSIVRTRDFVRKDIFRTKLHENVSVVEREVYGTRLYSTVKIF